LLSSVTRTRISSSDTEHKIWILQIRKEKERKKDRKVGRKDRKNEGKREIKILKNM